VGPTAQGGAIVYDELETTRDLPVGRADVQAPGSYRLADRADGALFGFSVGPGTFKRSFFPAEEVVLRARRKDGTFVVLDAAPRPTKVALIGARSCDLHALGIHDRVLRDGEARDPRYAARREGTFVVAVQCGQAGGTCFCASMGTGPEARSGFDLALTEILDGEGHRFAVEVGSPRGASLLARIAHDPLLAGDVEAAAAIVAKTRASMGRTLDTDGIREVLYEGAEHPRWDDVARRCLSCTSCTMVCPTCFCSTVETSVDAGGDDCERTRRWDSCFTADHSYYVHGGAVHGSTKARYRQWLTHKLAAWIDQFGTSGCVGCGRCITWCPVGIDLTEEIAALRIVGGRRGEP
jgi:ferredoxin